MLYNMEEISLADVDSIPKERSNLKDLIRQTKKKGDRLRSSERKFGDISSTKLYARHDTIIETAEQTNLRSTENNRRRLNQTKSLPPLNQKPVRTSESDQSTCPDEETVRYRRRRNTVDELLSEIIFGLGTSRRQSWDSDTGNSSTDPCELFSLQSCLPDVVQRSGYTKPQLKNKDSVDLLRSRLQIENQIGRLNQCLLLQLRLRDRMTRKRDFKYDIITATLQAMSPKRRVDTKMRFSVDPVPGDSGFTQWCAAMQMVSRLPGGIPLEFRKRLWLTLADRHIQSKRIDWKKTRQTCLNEKTNPDDDELGIQIVKDLHRTGCSMFSGEETEHNQALLKKVLLAYARWNKVVGYCQGFNMLAAIILEVMEWQEENALKVMIYLIEEVLPEGYFANHMRGLSVDMAVFRELLRMRFPILSQHLDRLQIEAQDTGAGTSYEPPLTNVFTMQWFLTLFSNCLPKTTVLRVWDLIFLEGNEVLLRTALSIWGGLADRVLTVESADEFYSIMGVLTREMLEFGIMDANDLIKTICTMTPLSISELTDMRDKYAYNIRPLSSTPFSAFKKNLKILYSDDDEDDDDNLAMATWCLSNTMQLPKSRGPMGFSDISPGAVSHGYGFGHPSPSSNNVDSERMSLDISALKKQYAKLRERQKQAHVILTGALANHSFSRQRLPIAVNHLLVGKKPLVRKNKPTSRIVFEFKSPSKHPGETRLPTSEAFNRNRANDTPTSSTLTWAEAKMERHKLRAQKNNNNEKLERHDQSDSSSYSSSSTELCDDEDTRSNCSDYAASPELDRKADTSNDVSGQLATSCHDVISDASNVLDGDKTSKKLSETPKEYTSSLRPDRDVVDVHKPDDDSCDVSRELAKTLSYSADRLITPKSYDFDTIKCGKKELDSNEADGQYQYSSQQGFSKLGYSSRLGWKSEKGTEDEGLIGEFNVGKTRFSGKDFTSYSSRYSSPYKLHEKEAGIFEGSEVVSSLGQSIRSKIGQTDETGNIDRLITGSYTDGGLHGLDRSKLGQTEGGTIDRYIDGLSTEQYVSETARSYKYSSTLTVSGTSDDDNDSISGDSSTITAHSTALSPSSNSTLVSETQKVFSLDSSPSNPGDSGAGSPDANSSSPYDSSPENANSGLPSPEFLDRNNIPRSRESISSSFERSSASQVRKKAHSLSQSNPISPIRSANAGSYTRSRRTTLGSLEPPFISPSQVKPQKSETSIHLASISSAAFSAASKLTSGLGDKIDFSKLMERRASKDAVGLKKYYNPFPTSKRPSPGSPVAKSAMYRSEASLPQNNSYQQRQ